MLLETNRPWRHRALAPLALTEATKGVYVAKWTDKRVTVYVPDDKGGVKKVAVAHKNLGKYAYKTVDPPPGEKPVGYVSDPWKYKGPADITKLDEPSAPTGTPAPAKQAKFVPVYDWNDKTVWVWVKTPGGPPLLAEVPHKKIKGYAKRLGWVDQEIKLVGKIDPTNYDGPSDIYPLDWDPGDGAPEFVPTAAQAMSMAFVPEYDDEVAAAEPEEEVVLKPVVDPNVPKLNIPAEFEVQAKKDPNGFTWVKHKGSGQNYSVLPDGTIAVWDKSVGKYFPIKKTSAGWDFDHDSPIVSPKSLKTSQAVAADKVSGPKPKSGMGIAADGEDQNGLPKYKITNPAPFPPEATVEGYIVWLPTKEWAYQAGKYFQTLEWEDGEWWEGDEEYAVSAVAKMKPSALPKGFKLPGEGYKIKTVTKAYVLVDTPAGEGIRWDVKKQGWFLADQPWEPWTPPSKAPKPAPGKDAPEGAPEAPPGFEIGSGPNKDGAWPLTTSEYHDDLNWFLLPNGKLAKYDEYKGVYETYTYTPKGWVLDKTPGLTSSAVKLLKYYPNPLPVPDGYKIAGYDLNGLPQVNMGPGTKLFTLLPNGMIATWSSSKEAYKTQTGANLTIGQVLTGDFGSIPVPKTELAAEPEDGAYATKFIDKLDFNGYPMVDEVDPDDPDSPYATKDLTLLPDGTLAKWKKSGAYTKYKWDTDEGYVPTYDSMSALDVDRLLTSLSLAVKGFRYHKVTQVGDEAAKAAGGPPGFELITPTAEQKGLIPAKHIATNTMYLLLPGNRAAGLVSGELYDLYQVGAEGKLTSLNKQVTLAMVRAMSMGYDPEPPIHSKFVTGTKAFDKNGYPRVVDEEGEKLTLLPNGEVAKWSKGTRTYEVWAYDYGFKGYYPRHPEKAYTLKQVEKLKLKKLKTFKSVSPTKAPEPKAAPPDLKSDQPVKIGTKDPNGHDVYEYKGIGMSKIPVDTGWGVWYPSKGYYSVRYYDKQSDSYLHKNIGGKAIVWYPGEPSAGTATPEKASIWSWEDSGNKDEHGKPQVLLKKKGTLYDVYAQLGPKGLLGKWSEANLAYVVNVVDKKAEGPTIPVYGTMALWNPAHEYEGLMYPLPIKPHKLPKEWKPTLISHEGFNLWVKPFEASSSAQATGTWEGAPAKLYASGTGLVIRDIETTKYLWTTSGGYTLAGQPDKAKAKMKPPVTPAPVPAPAKAVAADAAAAAQPTDKNASQLIADLAGKLPDIATLVHKGDGGHLGGAGKKDIFEDPTTGLKFIFKPAISKNGASVEPFRAHSQEAFAALATKVRADHVPIKTVTYKGKLGTLQPMIELDPKQSDLKKAGGMKPEELTPQQQEDVGTEHMLSWLMSQHDDHRGNLLKTKDGRIISVDKEQGWKYFAFDKLDVDFHPNGKYGEEEPFYNKFWRAFAEGKIDFDPMTLVKALSKIEDMASEDFLKTIDGYAKASFPGDEVKQYRFRKKALKRKLRLRKDFEDFITKLYQKRTGQKGKFDFEEGWLSDEAKKTTKYKTITIDAKDLIPPPGQKSTAKTTEAQQKFGIDIRVYPYEFVDPTTKQKTVDPTKLTLKIPKGGSETKFFEFLEQLGLEPIPFPNGEKTMSGQQYFMAAVDRAAFEAASITKKVLITSAFAATPAKPRYWPELPEAAQMEPTLEKDLKALDDKKLGREGHAMLSDGSGVEGQAAKAKRWKDKKGEYFFLTFKLRPKFWEKIRDSDRTSTTTYTWYEANYDAKKDLFVEKSTKITSDSGVEWEHQGVECFLATGKYAYRGQVYMKLRGISGSQVHSKAKAALNYAVEGAGDDIFRDPSSEDREVMKLMRVLWAFKPQVADKLPESKRTIPKLRALLKEEGVPVEVVGSVEEQEVFKGHHSHVIPGRWRKMDGLLFVWNGISTQEAALSIIQSGLMSISERNLAGLPKFGASYGDDEVSGSGDGSICRVAVKSGTSRAFSEHYGGGTFQAIMHPDVLDRLDCYMFQQDTYGTCDPKHHKTVYASRWKKREPIDKAVATLNGKYQRGNEVSFRKGVHKSKIVRITCYSEGSRKSLITAARDEGIEEVNGVPIEDFVVVASTLGEAYNRYVKPLMGA